MLGGERTQLQVAHMKLSSSRAFSMRAYLPQTHEMLFDALNEALRMLGGVPQPDVFDNMKTAAERIGAGKIRQVNARFAAMASKCRQVHAVFKHLTAPVRARVVQSGVGMGEGAGRVECPGCAPALVAAAAELH